MTLPKKTTSDTIYDLLAAPAQLFPPTAVITRLIDTYWPRTYLARMDQCVQELYDRYQELDNVTAKDFSNFIKTDEGETLLLMAMEAMVKTHKSEKIRNISQTLIGIINTPIKYDSKEYILKIATELEPFDALVLQRIYNHTYDYNTIESYEEFYTGIIKSKEITKDEFYYITQKLTQLSLIRISSMLDGFNDTYSNDMLITNGAEKETKPKIRVTKLGEELLNYFKK